jgi:predicted SprT family Zn-dependent metalloprotease
MKWCEADRRETAPTYEGFGEYRTRWANHEYRCPDCGCWSGGSDITLINDKGEHSMYCEACAAKIVAETPEFQAA